MIFYKTLSEANHARQLEWDAKSQIDGSYRGNELAGEAGEAMEEALHVILLGASVGRTCNIIKKLERERLGIKGKRESVANLGRELADVVICASLAANKFGINLDEQVAAVFNAKSEEVGLETRLELPA